MIVRTTAQVSRLSELPREIAPPHDLWPALEARLRGEEAPGCAPAAVQPAARAHTPRRRQRVQAIAAVLAALAAGIGLERWILAPPPAPVQPMAAGAAAPRGRPLRVAYLTGPRFLRERAALMRSAEVRLAMLPAPTRAQVLHSLAVIDQSIRQIRQAMGREPGNALLQELLIETYQDQMQVLSTAQALGGGGTEART